MKLIVLSLLLGVTLADVGRVKLKRQNDLESILSNSDIFGSLDNIVSTYPQISTFRNTDEYQQLIRNFMTGLIGGQTTGDLSAIGNGLPDDLVSLLRPWWQGNHVCEREEESEEQAGPTDPEFTMVQCYSSDDQYKCTTTITKHGVKKTNAVIKECCHGFERQAGSFGCGKAVELKSLVETMEDLNATDLLQVVRSSTDDLTDEYFGIGLNRTVFVVIADESYIADQSDPVFLDKAKLLESVKHYILDGFVSSTDMTDESTVSTILGEDDKLRFNSFPGDMMTVNCVPLQSKNHRATNGVVHTVPGLIPTAQQKISEILDAHADLSIFKSLLNDDEKSVIENNAKHATVMAFTNSAFEALPKVTQDKIKAKEDCFKDLIKEHIIGYTMCPVVFDQAPTLVRNSANNYLNFSRELQKHADNQITYGQTPVKINDANSYSYKLATNGYVFFVDRVLLPNKMKDVLTAASTNGGSVFTDLIEQHDLTETVTEVPEVTLFVPPNEFILNNLENITDVSAMIKNHVFAGFVDLNVEEPTQQISSLRETSMEVNVRAPLFFTLRNVQPRASVQCANIVKSVKTCNARIHFVDRILQTPTQSVLKIIEEDPKYSKFLMMVEAAEMTDLFDALDFKKTLLVPTNEAIESKITDEVMDQILVDDQRLKSFIKRHLLTTTHCCSSLGPQSLFHRTVFTTEANTRLLAASNMGRLQLGPALVLKCDKMATNGIVHEMSEPIPARSDVSIFSDLL